MYYGVMARCHKLPTTSQPSPELFQRFFLEAAAAGDEVVGIFLSHELSGTCQCARLAADMANVDNVLFVDSNVCLGESLLVRLAVQLRDAGKTAGQIAATLEHAKEHLHLVAVIDDLKYLRKGGRLPAAVAVAGGMLGIKPLITIKEGKVVMAGKARGLPGAYVALFKKIEELGGISTCADALAGYTLSPARCSPSRPTCRRIWAGTRPLCARSAASSAPTPAPARSAWPSSMKASPSELTQSKEELLSRQFLFLLVHSTASETILPSRSTRTTSIMGRMNFAPFLRAKWEPSRLPTMPLMAQGMPMENTTSPLERYVTRLA